MRTFAPCFASRGDGQPVYPVRRRFKREPVWPVLNDGSLLAHAVVRALVRLVEKSSSLQSPRKSVPCVGEEHRHLPLDSTITGKRDEALRPFIRHPPALD